MRENSGFFSGIIKGTLTAVIISLFSVLIFGGVVKVALLSQGVIKAVNQFIKIISVFLGCSFCVRGRMGLIRGAILGVLSTIVTYLIFSLFSGEIYKSTSFILDVIFMAVIGGVSGIIAVNVKK